MSVFDAVRTGYVVFHSGRQWEIVAEKITVSDKPLSVWKPTGEFVDCEGCFAGPEEKRPVTRFFEKIIVPSQIAYRLWLFDDSTYQNFGHAVSLEDILETCQKFGTKKVTDAP